MVRLSAAARRHWTHASSFLFPATLAKSLHANGAPLWIEAFPSKRTAQAAGGACPVQTWKRFVRFVRASQGDVGKLQRSSDVTTLRGFARSFVRGSPGTRRRTTDARPSPTCLPAPRHVQDGSGQSAPCPRRSANWPGRTSVTPLTPRLGNIADLRKSHGSGRSLGPPLSGQLPSRESCCMQHVHGRVVSVRGLVPAAVTGSTCMASGRDEIRRQNATCPFCRCSCPPASCLPRLCPPGARRVCIKRTSPHGRGSLPGVEAVRLLACSTSSSRRRQGSGDVYHLGRRSNQPSTTPPSIGSVPTCRQPAETSHVLDSPPPSDHHFPSPLPKKTPGPRACQSLPGAPPIASQSASGIASLPTYGYGVSLKPESVLSVSVCVRVCVGVHAWTETTHHHPPCRAQSNDLRPAVA